MHQLQHRLRRKATWCRAAALQSLSTHQSSGQLMPTIQFFDRTLAVGRKEGFSLCLAYNKYQNIRSIIVPIINYHSSEQTNTVYYNLEK